MDYDLAKPFASRCETWLCVNDNPSWCHFGEIVAIVLIHFFCSMNNLTDSDPFKNFVVIKNYNNKFKCSILAEEESIFRCECASSDFNSTICFDNNKCVAFSQGCECDPDNCDPIRCQNMKIRNRKFVDVRVTNHPLLGYILLTNEDILANQLIRPYYGILIGVKRLNDLNPVAASYAMRFAQKSKVYVDASERGDLSRSGVIVVNLTCELSSSTWIFWQIN